MKEASVNAETVRTWLGYAAASLRENRNYLTQLDAAIGDADHGTNMDRGFTAVLEKLAATDEETPPGRLLTTAGSTLVSTVGGASGPLWGTTLRRAGRAPGEAEAFDGVVELGAAQEGEKTMVDALSPAVRALRDRLGGGASVASALAAAREASDEGMRATVPLQASKGRASYLGERSIGHQDPGATSTALIVAALARAVPTDP